MNSSNKAYLGDQVKFYEKRRKKQAYWKKEQEAVFSFLSQISNKENFKNLTVLDIPVGTGRFFDFYKKFNFKCFGFDISDDMIEIAKEKAKNIDFNVQFKNDDITNISLEKNSVDLTVSIRILNILDFNDFLKAINEITRVSNKYIICGVAIIPCLKDVSFIKKINILFRRFFAKALDLVKGNKTGRWSEKIVVEQFSKNSLTILDKKRIDIGRGGYAYYIYFLKK